MTARVIVCGSRGWTDRRAISDRIAALALDPGLSFPPLLVHGRAPRGADRIVADLAERAGLPAEPHPADWMRHGKRAGFIRNEEMAALGADLCLAFWDGESRGTADMIERAEAHGIPVEVVRPS